MRGKSVFHQAIIKGQAKLRPAAFAGNVEEVRRLLSSRMLDVNHDNPTTSLFVAAQNGHKNVVSLLLEKGADPNKASIYLTTPLSTTALCGHTQCV